MKYDSYSFVYLPYFLVSSYFTEYLNIQDSTGKLISSSLFVLYEVRAAILLYNPTRLGYLRLLNSTLLFAVNATGEAEDTEDNSADNMFFTLELFLTVKFGSYLV